ncbi:MAG: FAD-dependent oxidoreductase [Caldilineaceae bacterium]
MLCWKPQTAPVGALTRTQLGISYDLGAVLAYDPTLFPADLPASPMIRSPAPAGIVYQGRIHYGQDVRHCLAQLGVAAAELTQLDHFAADPDRDAATLPPALYAMLNASFRDIHFGDLRDYLPQRQRDALHLSSPTHHLGGNGETVDYYIQQLGDRLRLATRVVAIDDLGDAVHLTVQSAGQQATLTARAAIVTTPAPVTLRLLHQIRPRSRRFLESVRYAPGSVVVLGLQGVRLADFSYLVTPELACNTILRQQHPAATGRPQTEVLLIYYAGAVTTELQSLDDATVIAQTLAMVQQLGIGTITARHVAFSDVHHWPAVGAIIGTASYANWDEQILQPSDHIWLAGDYLYVDDPANPMPYGMQAAVAAGGKAARTVARQLQVDTRQRHITQWYDYAMQAATRLVQRTVEQPLVMICHPPPPQAPYAYGDLVPLGFLLRALRRHQRVESDAVAQILQRYLLGRRTEKLWAFHSQTLITATDSSLVLLGIQGQPLREALDRLEAFRTVQGGYEPQLWDTTQRRNRMVRVFANAHWCQPDYGTTCVIYALRRTLGLPTGNTADYLRTNFDRRSALYYANPYLVDWVTALALQQMPAADDLHRQLCAEVVASVNADDTFGTFDMPFSTAAAALTLATLGYDAPLLQRVQLRLFDFMQRDGLWPAACPFYSTRRLAPGPSTEAEGTNSPHFLTIGAEQHALSLYEDAHRIITTAVALLALAPTTTLSVLPIPLACNGVNVRIHPRYHCVDHADYIAQHALPPYLPPPAPTQQIAANAPQSFSLTALDIEVKLQK